MAKLNNREAMVPWCVAFTRMPGSLPHFAGTAHATRIWAETREIAAAAAREMVNEAGIDAYWGVSGFIATMGAEPDGDLSIHGTDLFTSSLRGLHEFRRPPVAAAGCLDDDDRATIGANARKGAP